VGFDRIIGQDLLKSRMASEVVSRRGSTYIVSGPSGSGKTYISNELGKAFLCESPVQNGACGKCRCCLYSENGTNPDIIRVEPEKEGSNISVDRIRETVVGDYETAPRFSPNKVYIINGDALGKESQNALLKSIEEPPSDVIFIFEVTNTDTLLPTILSRAAEYKIRPYETSEVKQIISGIRPDLSEEDLDMLSEFADGIPGRGIRLSEDESFSELKDKLMELVLTMPEKKLHEVIMDSEEIFGEYQSNYLEPTILLMWLCGDIMRLVSDIDCESIRFGSDRTRIEKFTVAHPQIRQKEIGRAIEAIDKFVSDRKVNVNYDGSVTAMMLKIYKEFSR